jgi:hypothetical protein
VFFRYMHFSGDGEEDVLWRGLLDNSVVPTNTKAAPPHTSALVIFKQDFTLLDFWFLFF